jgi:hypothetical protein
MVLNDLLKDRLTASWVHNAFSCPYKTHNHFKINFYLFNYRSTLAIFKN